MSINTEPPATAGRPSWRMRPDSRIRWATLTGLGGVLCAVISVLIGMQHAGALSLSQANAMCSSPLGSLAAAFSAKAAQACSGVQLTEQVRGWLVVIGVVLIVAGTTWAVLIKAGERR